MEEQDKNLKQNDEILKKKKKIKPPFCENSSIFPNT